MAPIAPGLGYGRYREVRDLIALNDCLIVK
jgi:hypothetical protein